MAEGYTLQTDRTKKVWEQIITATGSQRVLEIGYNYGHATTILLDLGCKVHSVEINPECIVMMSLMTTATTQFSFTLADSKDLEVERHKNKYDLVFIDGEHTAKALQRDLVFAHQVGAKYIVVDDYNDDGWFYWIPDLVRQMLERGFPYNLVTTYDYDASGGDNRMALLCMK